MLWILFLIGMFYGKSEISECELLFSEGDTAYIVGKLYKKETGLLYLDKLRVYWENEYVAASERLPVYLAEENASQLPEIGSTVLVKGIIKTIQDAPNPGNFNQKSYYEKQNIHIMLQKASVVKEAGSVNRLQEILWQLRQVLAERIKDKMDETYSGILCAMLLGDTSDVNAEVKEVFQKTGIGHLIAISGLHMSFIGMGLLWILKKAGVHKQTAIIVSVIGLTVYLLLSGSGASSQRAYIMFVIRMGAILLGREYDGLTALSVAAMIAFIQNPLQLFDAGFLLSYGAVIGIYAVAPKVERLVGKKFSVPMGLQMVLLPVMLGSYYEICTYSVLWNLIAVPLSSAVLFLGISGVLLNLELPLKIVEGILWFYHKGSVFVLTLPGARMVIGKPEIVQILSYALFLMLALWFLGKRKEPVRSVILLVAAFVILWAPQQYSEKLEIAMIDVGQGDCFFLETSGGTRMLIDGGSSSVSSVGKYRIEPFLKSQGVGSLDYVFVTHGDEDHLSGIREMLERQQVGVRIKCLVLPSQNVWDEKIEELVELAKGKDVAVYVLEQGRQLILDEVKIICLWPNHTIAESGNEASMVLSVSCGAFDALFTGDLEKESETKVCEYIKALQKKKILPLDYEVLKVGHHGSKNSTSEKLLGLLQADVAFISAGEENFYGHPHEEVLNRLANRAINLYNTKDGNAVKLCTDGEKYYILEP